MPEVVVLGAGVVGASIAFRLAQRGAKVTLVEARRPAAGTTSTSFAWTNANNKQPLAYHQLNVAGMGEHELLAIELGGAPWFHRSGNVEWALDDPGAAALHEKVRRLREWGYAAEYLDRAELRAFEPELAAPLEADPIVVYPFEHYLEPPPLVAALLARFRALGGTLVTGRRATGIESRRERVEGIAFEDGTRLEAETVVAALGRWTELLLGDFGIRMAPTNSLLVVTTPVATSLRSMVQSPEINLRPDGGGRVLLQDNRLDEIGDADDVLRRKPGTEMQLLARARAVLPALADAEVERAVVGIRAIPYDGLPVVGHVPSIDGLYAACTHSGVTLGPLLGRLVAREIAEGRNDPRLDAFRPSRFLVTR